jgi:tetratricopeptide (TPR) repeat protein
MHLLRAGIFYTLIILLSISVGFASGVGPSADEMFKRGTNAFANGDYEQAVEFFKAAKRSGLNTLALHYNLGVTYFRLKHYREAQQEFERLTGDSGTAPLAHYNLGRIALEGGEKSKARDHFQTTFRTATNKKLRRLADDRLRELAAAEKDRRWSGYFSLGAGYDDNAALIADSQVLVGNAADEFLELVGSTTGQLKGTKENGLQLKATGYYQNYLDLDEFDFGNFRIGPEIDQKLGEWNTSLTGFIDLAYIGGDLFERILNMELRGTRKIYSNLDLRLKYQLGLIDAESPFDSLSGDRHRMTAGLRSVLSGAYTGLDYTLELNDRDDPDFPTRQSIDFFAERDLTEVWSAGVNASYRYSDFEITGREDERIWLGLRISRSIPKGFRVFGKYDRIRNTSNRVENEYTSNIFSIGLERFF